MYAGIGLSAKFIEKGGADLILVYNSGRFRMAGRGSLAGMMPYSDANQVVVEMVRLPTFYNYSCILNNDRQTKSSP
jgi:predicted TIM-barrel enzyme